MNKKIQMILLALCGSFAINLSVHAASNDKIVAIVNKEIITQSQLNQQAHIVRQQATAARQPVPSQSQVLDKMIDTILQLQLAKNVGIEANDEMVEQTIEGIAQRNGLTTAQLQEALKREGIDFTRYRKDMREQIIISQLQQRIVGGKIKINDDDIAQQMRKGETPQNSSPTEYHIADILLALPENATAEDIAKKRKEAEESLAHLRQGASFEELAVVKSGGPDALKGGDLGWRKLSEIPSIFIPHVQKMRPGQLSDVIQAPNGFHILHIVDIRGGDPQLQSQRSVTETEARHILLRNTVLTKGPDLKLRLLNIRRDIEHGADFKKMAEQYSQDTQSAPKGGDLGWIRSGTMDPSFEQAMASLKPGQISQPFATSAGWHLVQVLNRRTVDNSKNFAKENARQQAYGRKADEAIKIWLKQVRAEAYIKILLNK